MAVVIGFFICFAPHHAQRLLYIYGKALPNYREINEYMYYTTGCFYYVSATINPIPLQCHVGEIPARIQGKGFE